ncbi:hypothetical protein CHX27_08545 [Flavobacterium aurantiibacter]|uniref:Uncharacterized protein n=1 Tax=Flavobacterium aurantiibacter TaxID=2023067 RepID=A0A255ZSL7_9FLAO|nr:hypothetical protein CHX27_08545 [Flavobacterium aurantiibacter]
MDSKRDISALIVCIVVLAVLYIFPDINIWIKLLVLSSGLVFVSLKTWTKYKKGRFKRSEVILLGIGLIVSVTIFLRSYLYL